MNMYGEKLEGPAAQFRRDKIANQAKYDSMMLKEREMSQKVCSVCCSVGCSVCCSVLQCVLQCVLQ